MTEVGKQDFLHFDTEYGPMRVCYDKHGNRWWSADNVCRILDLDVQQSLDLLDEWTKEVFTYRGRKNLRSGVAFVNNLGFYVLISHSKAPNAKKIRHWPIYGASFLYSSGRSND
jgi:prophage antirepressor-like protein